MRTRNVKNKEEILENCSLVIRNPMDYKRKWHEVFQNNHAIHLEIGMGKGKFIYEMAKLYPDINFIGVEKSDSILAKAILRMPETLPNLRLICLDALELANVFDHEITTIYLNFSDPWPKNRHQNRRLTSPKFLQVYDLLFQDKNQIALRTDNELLFVYSLKTLSQHGYYFEEVSLDYHQEKQDQTFVMTEYEEKFSSKGKNIFYLFAKKR